MRSGRERLSVEDLIELIQDADPLLRIQAGFELQSLGEDAFLAVPILIEMLKQGDVQDRKLAAATLRKIGPAAYEAVPALLEAADGDEDEGVSDLALQALEEIDLVEPDDESDAEAA